MKKFFFLLSNHRFELSGDQHPMVIEVALQVFLDNQETPQSYTEYIKTVDYYDERFAAPEIVDFKDLVFRPRAEV